MNRLLALLAALLLAAAALRLALSPEAQGPGAPAPPAAQDRAAREEPPLPPGVEAAGAPTGEQGSSEDSEDRADVREEREERGEEILAVEVPPRPPRPRGASPAGSSRPPAADLVSGVVRDHRGRPIAGVEVLASVPGPRGVGGRILAHTKTDAEGKFALWVPRAAKPRRLDFVREGYLTKRLERLPGEVSVRLEPETGVRIEGRLVGRDGRPLAEEALRDLFETPFAPQPDRPPPTRLVFVREGWFGQIAAEDPASVDLETGAFRIDRTSAPQGEVVFWFRGLPALRHLLPVAPPGEEPPLVLGLDPESWRGWLAELEIVAPGADRLVCERDAPRGTVRPLRMVVRPEPDGAARLEGIPSGAWRLAAWGPGGFAFARVDLDGRRTVRLLLEPGLQAACPAEEGLVFGPNGVLLGPSGRFAALPRGGAVSIGGVWFEAAAVGSWPEETVARRCVLEAPVAEAGDAFAPQRLEGRVEVFDGEGRLLGREIALFELGADGVARCERGFGGAAAGVRVDLGERFSGRAALPRGEGRVRLVREGP